MDLNWHFTSETVLLVVCSVPADCGWWPTSDGGLGAMMGVWLSPFSAGSVTLWSTLDSEGASLPASTCQITSKIQHLDKSTQHICKCSANYWLLLSANHICSKRVVHKLFFPTSPPKPKYKTRSQRIYSILQWRYLFSLVVPESCMIVCRHSFGNPLSTSLSWSSRS